jgi:hypothetical protein
MVDADSNTILSVRELLVRRARDPKSLKFAIDETRSRIEARVSSSNLENHPQ